MKTIKQFSIIAAGFVILSATSCSKAYNCHCIYKGNGTVIREDDHQINEGKRSKSEAKCKEMDRKSYFVNRTSYDFS